MAGLNKGGKGFYRQGPGRRKQVDESVLRFLTPATRVQAASDIADRLDLPPEVRRTIRRRQGILSDLCRTDAACRASLPDAIQSAGASRPARG